MSTADALCLLLLALLQGHCLGYLLEGQILTGLLQSRTEVARKCWAWGAVASPACWGGTTSSRCPLHELLGVAFQYALGASRTRWLLHCGISKGTPWARWYPVLGGAQCRSVRQDDTRGHEICWNSFVRDGKGGCKTAFDPSSPVHHPLARTSFPCTFCRITSVKPHELSRQLVLLPGQYTAFQRLLCWVCPSLAVEAAGVRMEAVSRKHL